MRKFKINDVIALSSDEDRQIVRNVNSYKGFYVTIYLESNKRGFVGFDMEDDYRLLSRE